MNIAKKISILSFLALGSSAFFFSQGEAPSGYYSKCEGKTGQALLKALHETVGSHTVVSYDGLNEVFKTSDVYPDGKLWDMYSTKHWNTSEKCGSYKLVGDCWNKEHSMPKSWFNKATPMYSDAFHLYPTDGKVNGQRSNFPFGECSGGSSLPSSGGIQALGRLGTSTYPGYTGKVFEPDDQYKGDFARTYFYMAAAYNDRISTWNSDMLAGNSYPVYNTWAVNMLLKWHRQDQVSNKETTRNDAIYAYQKNRNPFIDHPELAEYIWGNQQGEPWYPGGKIAAIIATPANGTEINLGKSGIDVSKVRRVNIAASGLTSAITASVSGSSNITITGKQLSVDNVKAGNAYVELTLLGSQAGQVAATLTLVSGDAKSVVTIKGEVVNGIPAEDATEVTEESFRANWVNISGDGAIYSLDVTLNGESLAGYPRNVYAEDESEAVTGLEPETTYQYILSEGAVKSNTVTVTTAAPVPAIYLLFDGDLTFDATAGEPSEVWEFRLDAENISGDITVTVDSPFQLSTNKSKWSDSIILSPEEDRFYIRLFSATPGVFTADLEAEAGDYTSDHVEIKGVVGNVAGDFLEDFEKSVKGNYNDGDYEGTTGNWYFANAGVYKGDHAYEGSGAVRFGKVKTPCYIEMQSDKSGGCGTVTFYAEKWSANEATPTVTVDYSTDGGDTWTTGPSIEITGTEYAPYSATINKTGNVRIRINRTAGARFMLDALSMTPYGMSGVNEVEDYHTWDAYCLEGQLVIENTGITNHATVYGVDGVARFDGLLPVGETTLNLAPGLYIVVVDNFSRRVLVK
ncbi:MAG: endonuclease [Muribaculaceae bacterium]|nr:endonuclease [Muribaculaceae bacterium]